MIEGDALLREFVTKNLDCILIAFYFLQGLWPHSRILASLRAGFSQVFSKAKGIK
jgi:hypothetical protein